MNRLNNRTRGQWMECGRCGIEHPVSALVKQKGLMVCHCHGCYDDLSAERRPRIIAEILADGKESRNPKADRQTQEDTYNLEF